MKNIIVPTDFSENAEHALMMGVLLANHFDATIHVISVYPDLLESVEMSLPPYERTWVTYRLKLEELAKEIEPTLTGKAKLKSHFVRDYVPEGIARASKKYKGDIIVMGTKGASNLKGLFLGTNTAKVIGLAKIPVLTIPDDAEIKLPSFVMMGLDKIEDEHDASFAPLLDLKSKLNFKTSAFRIETTPASGMIGEPVVIDQGNDLWDYFTEVQHDKLLEGIRDEVAWEEPDWLCVVHQERGFFAGLFSRSLSKKLAYETKIPLLVLHKD